MGCWVGRHAGEVSLATIAEFWILMLDVFGWSDRKVKKIWKRISRKVKR